jgi:DNA (cytosine-5)-methyltransferase 1
LFAGIGGFDLGFQRAGFEIKWQVEIDPFCRRVLEKHFPEAKRYKDVRTVGAADLERVDVLCGGFPCQPHSVAGRRRGAEDERDLWPAFARLVRELEPRWVVAENVPGLLSNDAGRFFGGVLRDLAESGYDAEWDCLPASAFGAPHRRDRVWLVAYTGREQLRHESGRRSGSGGTDSALTRNNGATGHVADADERRCEVERFAEPSRLEGARRDESDGCGALWKQHDATALADAGRITTQIPTPMVFAAEQIPEWDSWWAVEPDVGRVAHGVPARVDRLRGLGNAIVPQIAEWIARRIREAEEVMTPRSPAATD